MTWHCAYVCLWSPFWCTHKTVWSRAICYASWIATYLPILRLYIMPALAIAYRQETMYFDIMRWVYTNERIIAGKRHQAPGINDIGARTIFSPLILYSYISLRLFFLCSFQRIVDSRPSKPMSFCLTLPRFRCCIEFLDSFFFLQFSISNQMECAQRVSYMIVYNFGISVVVVSKWLSM